MTLGRTGLNGMRTNGDWQATHRLLRGRRAGRTTGTHESGDVARVSRAIFIPSKKCKKVVYLVKNPITLAVCVAKIVPKEMHGGNLVAWFQHIMYRSVATNRRIYVSPYRFRSPTGAQTIGLNAIVDLKKSINRIIWSCYLWIDWISTEHQRSVVTSGSASYLR